MTKLLVLLIGVPLYLRFRFRKNPRLRARLLPWSAMTAAGLLLLVAPWHAASDVTSRAFAAARLAGALGLIAYVAWDVRRTFGIAKARRPPS